MTKKRQQTRLEGLIEATSDIATVIFGIAVSFVVLFIAIFGLMTAFKLLLKMYLSLGL